MRSDVRQVFQADRRSELRSRLQAKRTEQLRRQVSDYHHVSQLPKHEVVRRLIKRVRAL
jgi:hypothetical protein